MWTLLTLFVFLALIVYFMFFWVPAEWTMAASGESECGRNGVTGPKSATGARLTAQRCWHGVTFHGYQDEYCLATGGSAQAALDGVREFFVSKSANVLVEEPYHLRFSRGRRKFEAYLTGLDTWFPQDIDVSLQTKSEGILIALRYRVRGIHVRIPPNQLRREALELQCMLQIPGAEPTAAPNAAPPHR